MNGTKRILVISALLALAGSGIGWWLSQSPKETHKVSNPAPDLPAGNVARKSEFSVRKPREPTRFSSSQRFSAPSIQPNESQAAALFQNAHNLRDLLEGAHITFDWSEKQTIGNWEFWYGQCQSLENLYLGPEAVSASVRSAYRASMKEFCGDFTTAIGPEYESYLEQASQAGDWLGFNPPEWHETARNGDSQRARELAVSHLYDSLARMDEFGIAQSLAFLVLQKMIDPPFSDERLTGQVFDLYFNSGVYTDVGAALLCSHLGGCRGETHPYVLRHCLRRPLITCYQPADIFDAIYQTQTPIEHAAFWKMFNQVNALLAAHRRR